MTIIQRPFRGELDLARMAALVFAYPDQNFHVVDLAYRLASWAISDVRNTALWEDETGQLMAWGVAQRPFAALDYAVKPDVPSLENRVLEWSRQRWQEITDESDAEVYFFTGARDDHSERIARLEQHGFGRDAWGMSHMRRSMHLPIPEARIPDGFVIRPLAGEREVAAYTVLHRLAFGTKNMTEDWRAQTLRQPGYLPDLDLVAIAPDGTLAGFCICWVVEVQGEMVGQVEPLGVHPAYQGHGLGSALLVEGLRRMGARGANTAMIEAYRTDPVSQHLYKAVGFQTIYEATAYSMVLSPVEKDLKQPQR